MTEVTCGIRAYDPHELLCHAIADRLGFYAEEGLTVRLQDTTFARDSQLPITSYFQVACGAAALGRKAGHPWKIVFAAVDRPLFWLYGSVTDLVGARIASYPLGSPPDLLVREALGPIEADLVPSASDIVRLGLLRSGAVDAAVISSAVCPPTGLQCLLFVGDRVAAVTTGIAVNERALIDQRDLVASIVHTHQRALAVIHSRSDEVFGALLEVFGLPQASLDRIEPCFTSDGRSAVARDPGLFDFSLVP